MATTESRKVHGQAIGTALQEEGLLPPHCNLVEVSVSPSGAATIRYTVFVAVGDLHKLARALAKTAETLSHHPERDVSDGG